MAFRPMMRGVLGAVTDPLAAVIAALFSNNEQGALYDPSDLSTLYQDSAGTTPVTADGDPVGLMLDLSQGLGRGDEVLTNGDFDSDLSSWLDPDDAWSWSADEGGSAFIDGATSGPASLFQNAFASGASYEVTADVVISSGVMEIRDSAATSSVIVSESGIVRFVVHNHSGGIRALQFRHESGTLTAHVRSASVKELPGNHAVQDTTAEKPLYDLTDGIHSVEHDLDDDNLVVNLPDLGTDATVKYVTSGGITTLENQTISGDYTLPQATWQGVVIYEGPMSSAQAAAVDAWLTAKAGL